MAGYRESANGEIAVNHAGSGALDGLEELLAEIRLHAGLVEKKRGVFYRRSRAFLHFHEDPAGLFADIRPADEWTRYPVTTAAERRTLAGLVADAMKRTAEPVGPEHTKQRRTTS